MRNRFWKERYCPAHEHDGSVSCTGCARLRRPDSDDIAALGDGRFLCLECLSSFVPDTAAAQPLYEDVLQFYAQQHGMKLPEKPPLMLVEHSGLNEACGREGRSGGVGGPATHTRGLCLIEHVTSVRTGRFTRADSGALTSSSELVPLRHDKNTYVVAILVLAGLPAVVTGAVIAHEVMHAWLRMHGIRKMTEQAEEGLCQLMSYLWLEAQNIEVRSCRSLSVCCSTVACRCGVSVTGLILWLALYLGVSDYLQSWHMPCPADKAGVQRLAPCPSLWVQDGILKVWCTVSLEFSIFHTQAKIKELRYKPMWFAVTCRLTIVQHVHSLQMLCAIPSDVG